ncbi:uncharacterized protein PgNI_07189 [Pyricularia grisea]|uniref:Uncharacterized protein n=1 Tax=Pyricularia grisea TaxID=148305 RepID=A0A6P8B2K5_PYRGI|nr:uncharacterized protein PgNI_07189 [Pyricularia grisea]TLD09097.1 hypothetical protein PgNI_07189 [Pyricularia grisea]
MTDSINTPPTSRDGSSNCQPINFSHPTPESYSASKINSFITDDTYGTLLDNHGGSRYSLAQHLSYPITRNLF